MADKQIQLFETKEDKPGVIERAVLKTEINKERPGAMKYEGLEKIYSPKGIKLGTDIGDSAAMLLAFMLSKGFQKRSNNKIDNYLAEGNSPETKAKADRIVKSNQEIMSQTPTAGKQIQLMANTVEESRLPKDDIRDLERVIKENPNLSEAEMEKIKNETLRRWVNDQKPLNNLEATRPSNDVWAHSINTALDYGILLHEAFPKMTSNEIAERMEAAKLHDYGKSFVRLNDLVTNTNYKIDEAGPAKKAEVDTHTERGAEALKKLGEERAAKFAKEHHSSPNDIETQLLKAADIFNALTMERVYKGEKAPENTLKIMKSMIVDGVITQKAFDILEKAVEDGKLGGEPKFSSPLEDVYATEAGNAVKQKGIRLFDVQLKEPETAAGFNTFNSIISGIMAGHGLRAGSDWAMNKVSKKAKYNALMKLYKDDKVMRDRLKNGYYKDAGIDRLFKENVDRIINRQSN